ncbi:MAG: division/cell wall cluster transcriptional repressor MraZ [Firmicutes bacterium]|nr:division/cell wall cluster transcriptional repressor MraZ [Bacillota bacterium]
MFIGEFRHTMDEKGRLIMPSKFRDGLRDRFVATRGLDTCLFVYTLSEWETLEEKLKTLPFTRAEARAFTRLFLAGASECEIDRQGRFVIPAPLREYARIEKDVVIIGVSNRVEIWSQAEWDAYMAKAAEKYEEFAENLVGI